MSSQLTPGGGPSTSPSRIKTPSPKASSPRPPPEDEAIATSSPIHDTIEADDAPPEEDEFLAEGWDANSNASTSITSTIYHHTYENGRRYHAYKHGRYPIPNDDLEQNREDMKHAMMMEMTDGRLFLSPIGPNPSKIIDIGTGTGIWAIEVGDQFPGAEVLGLDLSPIQPQWIPPNVRFMIDDVEDDWASGSGWDFAHFRSMALVLRDLQKAIDQTYRNLKPGGWIEFQESHVQPLCDDGTMPPDDILVQFSNLCVQALAPFGMDLNVTNQVGPYLERAGFVNIQCVRRKVPLGVWPRDKTQRLIGLYNRETARHSIPSLSKAFATLGMSQTEIQVWGAKVMETLDDIRMHRYYYYYFWFAQKPE